MEYTEAVGKGEEGMKTGSKEVKMRGRVED